MLTVAIGVFLGVVLLRVVFITIPDAWSEWQDARMERKYRKIDDDLRAANARAQVSPRRGL